MSVDDRAIDPMTDRQYRYRVGVDEPLPVAVARAVAGAADVEPEDLVPVQHSMDADALDALDGGSGGDDASWTLTFAHAGYEVTISDGKLVTVYDASDEE